MNSSHLFCLCCLAIFMLVLPLCFSGPALGEDFRGKEGLRGSPDLVLSSVSGNLELGRPSSIFVILRNEAGPAAGEDEMAVREDVARNITAQLISSDERIRVLSRPQFGGLLEGGASVTLQFTALAEGLPLGLYPLSLICNFSRLSAVRAEGSGGAPGMLFEYQEVSLDLPLQVETVMGPRIEIDSPDGWWEYVAPGRESSIELILINRGDEPALDLQLQVRPSPPILMVENGWTRVNLSPGQSAEGQLSLFADENASSRYYALPCLISYRDGAEQELRREESAAVIYVGQRWSPAWIYLAGAAVAGILLLSARLALERLGRSRRRLRIVRS